MTRRAVPIAAGWFSGLFAAFYLCVCGRLGFLTLIAFAAAAGIFAIAFRARFRLRALAVLGAFAAAVCCSCVCTEIFLKPLEALDGAAAQVSGKVIDFSEGDRSAVTVKGTVGGIPAKAVIYVSGFSGDIGDGFFAEAEISAFEDTPFFAGRQNYLPDGIFISGSAGQFAVTLSQKTLFDRLRGYSRRVADGIRRYVGGEAGDLMAALTTGDRSLYSNDLRIRLNRSGIGHIAAVSGLHVSIVCAAVYFVCKRLRAGRIFTAVASELSVVMFTVFSGMRASAVRAALMLSLAVLATVFLKRQDPLNTLCVCAMAMTLFNPYAAADISTVLSLAGVAGVAVMSKSVCEAYKIKSAPAKAVCASVCAVFASLPFAALWFDAVSLASPIGNLFAIPLCTASLIFGMLFALTGASVPFLAKFGGFFSGLAVSLSDILGKLRLYIPLGRPVAGICLILLFIAVAAVYLIGKSTKRAVKTAAVLSAAFIAFSAASAAASADVTELYALRTSSGGGAVLRKGRECIIIDLDGHLSNDLPNFLERLGVGEISAAALSDSSYAYSAYADMGVENIYLYGASGAVGGSAAANIISPGAELDAFGTSVTLDGGVCFKLPDGSEVYISNGAPPGQADISVSFLKGLTVINSGGEPEVIKGEFAIKLADARRQKGGQDGA